MKCKSCDSMTIQGVFVHEKGCPESYKNTVLTCKWCGSEFTPESNENQEVCSHSCMVLYNGFDCDCEECNPTENQDEEDILYENKWCKIISKGTIYILKSKTEKYNDQYYQTFESALKAIGLTLSAIK